MFVLTRGKATLNQPDSTKLNLPVWPEAAGSEPAFFAPWQAKLFALTVHLNEQGLFTWEDWTSSFGARLEDRRAKEQESPEIVANDYFQDWLATLEEILSERDLTTFDEIVELTEKWQAAARATPHGQPILLDN